ncbi:hypothetical protein C0J52_27087 [Blattella germanica]|nr:hypothetical protein C0J52_27087 [Blattella germanica]
MTYLTKGPRKVSVTVRDKILIEEMPEYFGDSFWWVIPPLSTTTCVIAYLLEKSIWLTLGCLRVAQALYIAKKETLDSKMMFIHRTLYREKENTFLHYLVTFSHH